MRSPVAASAPLLAAFLWCACPGEPVKPPPAPPVDECVNLPALSLQLDATVVKVNGSLPLKAQGGSGHYTYSLQPGGSGGEVRTDRYVAGPTPATDTLQVADDCGNSNSVSIDVRAAFSVAPARATVRPGTAFTIAVTGLTGTATFTAMQLQSGGTVSVAGAYVAGTVEGLDLISISDSATGEQALLQYRVSRAARFRASPSRLAVPTSGSAPLEVVDGSGVVRWRKVMGPGAINGTRFEAEATATGVALLEGTDQFTLETTQVAVRVLDELQRKGRPHGRLSDVASLVTGDFDGDGVPDVALGVPESDLARPQGGAVFIFKGTPQGLPHAPTWVIAGSSDTSQLGAVMAAGDLDGDGKADLAVSEPGADITVNDSGAVRLYRFTAEGPKPMRDPLTGLGRGNFGAAMAIADVDGDGDQDLVVGSPGADLAATNTVSGRGVLDVFVLQKGTDIPDLGAVRLGGWDVAADGTFKTTTQLRFGRALAAGDLNADGRLDVAWLGTAGLPQADGGVRAQNAVAVHFGRDNAAKRFEDKPDVYVYPANVADGDEGNARLGFVPPSAGKPPLLLVTLERADSPNLSMMGGTAGGSNAGGALLFDVSNFKPTGAPAANPTLVQRTDAYARLYGDQANVQAGRSFAVADVDGQPGVELVLGAPYATVADAGFSYSNAGKLLIYSIASLSPGTVQNRPTEARNGGRRIDVLGTAVASWAPGGGSGLVAFAHRATTSFGDFTGRLDAFAGSGPLNSWSTTSAEVPAALASEQFGVGLDVAAINGAAYALVGAPGFSGPDSSGNGNDTQVGQTVLYAASGAPLQIIHEGSTGYYRPDAGAPPRFGGRAAGFDVAYGDFDGDGIIDAITAVPGFVTPLPNSTEYAALTIDGGCTPASGTAVGGAVVAAGLGDGTFKEAFRVWAPPSIASCDAGTCTRQALGRFGLASGFDFDHDGKQDVALARTNGLEVLLGSARTDMSLVKPTQVCQPAYSLPQLAQNTFGPVALGDLDGDGCDEVAVRYGTLDTTFADFVRSPNGVVIVYGFDAVGGRCGASVAPSAIRISGEPEVGLNSMQLGFAVTRAGKVLGDNRDFVAISARLYPFEGVAQPTVLLFDVQELNAKRPASGITLVAAVGDGLSPIPLVYRERAPQLGRALVGNIDLTGDGVVDLVVGAPGANASGDGVGAVFVFQGGASMQGAQSSVLTLFGDGRERGNFGQELAVSKASGALKPFIGVSAPASYRTGTANGAAWLVSTDF